MSYVSSLKFPYKLWKIVNECKSGAISWDSSGKVVLINYKVFKRDYLDSDHGFKTANMSSLIRQLNLYGFRKVSATSLQEFDRNIHAYQNDNFVYGNKSLLNFVCRKPSGVKRQSKKNKQQHSPHNKHLIACRNAFSTALENAVSSKRRSQFPDKKSMGELFEKDMFPISIDQELSQQFETDDVLNEYNSLFNNDSSLFSDIDDTIPIMLPQEIALNQIYILPNGIRSTSWNKCSNNHFEAKENEEEIGQSMDEKDNVDMNEAASVLPKINNETTAAAYSFVFDSSFAENSKFVYWNVADDLAFPSASAIKAIDYDVEPAPQDTSNYILTQAIADAGYEENYSTSEKSTTAQSVFENYQSFSDGGCVEFL